MNPAITLAWLLAVSSLVAAEVRYRVVSADAAPLPPYHSTFGHAINDLGAIVCDYIPADLSPAGVFVFKPDGALIWAGEFEGRTTFPSDVNEAGTVVAAGSARGCEVALRYNQTLGWQLLGDLGGSQKTPVAVNRHGAIVGTAHSADETAHAFLYSEDIGMIDLGTFGGASAYATDINDAGYITGFAYFPDGGYRAYIYRADQGVRFLGPGRAYAIAADLAVLIEDAFLDTYVYWNDQWELVRPGDGVNDLMALGMNDNHIVVGIGTGVSAGRVFVWSESEGTQDLQKLIAPDAGWDLSWATDINNRGQITGQGWFEGKAQAFRLDPIPPKLSIHRTPTNLVVEWHPDWPGVVLESASSLTSPDWRPLETGNTNVVAVSPTDTAHFFRLNLEGIRGLCCVPEGG